MKTIVFLLVLVATVYGALRLPLKARRTNTLITSLGIHFGAGPRIPLQGGLDTWGEYFTTIGLGSPPQYVQLQVDTGSSDLIVYSANCDGCNATHSYDMTKSNTVNEIDCQSEDYNCDQTQCQDGDGPCQWSDSYGDGSTITGVLVTDLITIGSVTAQDPVSFGPIQSVDAPDGFEATGVDGIWGLAFQSLSGWGGAPAIALFIEEYSLYDSFSLCLLANSGVMEIGTDYSKAAGYQWTPVTQDQWYTVELEDWKMGNKSIGLSYYDLNWNGVIVDSGTTLLIVDSQIFQAIRTLVSSQCSTNPLVGVCGVKVGQGLFDGACYHMENSDIQKFPNLTLNLQGTTGLTISAFQYLWEGTGEPNMWCLGIQAMDNLPVIIGDVFLQNFHTVFDRYQDQVGFGPLSSCP